MPKVFKLNLRGLNALMKSAEMCGVLNKAAVAMARTAGDGYEAETAHPISFVGITSVRTASRKAALDNNQNNTLLKAAGGTKI